VFLRIRYRSWQALYRAENRATQLHSEGKYKEALAEWEKVQKQLIKFFYFVELYQITRTAEFHEYARGTLNPLSVSPLERGRL